MAFPANWPPKPPTAIRSARVFLAGTAGAAFADAAFLFVEVTGANPYTATPYVRPGAEMTTVNLPKNPLGGGRAVQDATIAGGAVPPPSLWVKCLRISNDSSTDNLEFSFDGTTVHGRLLPGETREYRERYEAGIAVRGAGVPYRIEGW